MPKNEACNGYDSKLWPTRSSEGPPMPDSGTGHLVAEGWYHPEYTAKTNPTLVVVARRKDVAAGRGGSTKSGE